MNCYYMIIIIIIMLLYDWREKKEFLTAGVFLVDKHCSRLWQTTT